MNTIQVWFFPEVSKEVYFYWISQVCAHRRKLKNDNSVCKMNWTKNKQKATVFIWLYAVVLYEGSIYLKFNLFLANNSV